MMQQSLSEILITEEKEMHPTCIHDFLENLLFVQNLINGNVLFNPEEIVYKIVSILGL